VEQADLPDTLLELDAITEREGWRNLYLHALHAYVEQEARQHPPRGDANMPTGSAESFVSDRHQIKIGVRGSEGLPGWRRLRPSSVIAFSLSKTKPWSRTLIEVDTKGKRLPRRLFRWR
jgi:hypothetical protein